MRYQCQKNSALPIRKTQALLKKTDEIGYETRKNQSKFVKKS